MGKPRWYTWTVQLKVDASWVADGFNMDDERAHEMLAKSLPYAFNTELQAKVISAPDPRRVRKEQGYES